MIYKLFFTLYQIVRSIRYAVLRSVFGSEIHCKHSPTCGTYLLQKTKERGILAGTAVSLKRVMTCF